MKKYQERCGDCGGDIKEPSISHRGDICDPCWENRGWLLKNREMIGMKAFAEVQRAMAGHRGTAKRRIEKLKVF